GAYARPSLREKPMAFWRLAAWSTAALAASLTAGHAGPCTAQIDHMQKRIDAKLAANASSGPSARETVGARLRHQPTPESIAKAEAELGELPPTTVTSIRQAMAAARAADSAGDVSACEQALAIVQRAIGPE